MPVVPYTDPDTVASLLERYHVDVAHATYVALQAERLFDVLHRVHKLQDRMRVLLKTAATLHNVGLEVDEPNHELTGRDIIADSSLPGFDPTEQNMLACMIAFHRKSVEPTDEPLFGTLNATAQQQTLVLSALIRIADGLDASRTQTTEIEGLTENGAGSTNPSEMNVAAATALLLRVQGPYSHGDAASATSKADLWNTQLPSLQVAGTMARPGLTLDDTMAHAGRRILRYQAALLLSDEWRMENGRLPRPKQIHQLRVASRRLRSTLRVFKPHYKGKAVEPVIDGVRDLASSLAVVRELDVAVGALKHFQRHGDVDHRHATQLLMDTWESERGTLRAGCVSYLQSERHASWLQRLTDFVQTDAYDRAREPGQPFYLRHAIDLVMARHIAEVRAYDALPDHPPVMTVHALRVAIKRLRYMGEALREVLPAERVDNIVAACIPAQNNYGAMHDAFFVAERALRFVAEHRGGAQQVDQRVIRNILVFAESQQQVVEDHLRSWRSHLEPLLIL